MKEKFVMPTIEKKERPLTRVERLFGDLKEQYQFQIKAQLETGIMELMPDGKAVGYYDFKNQPRPVPTYEEIVSRMDSKIELLEYKYRQGFTRIQITPQLISLDFLFERTREEIIKAKREGRLRDADGEELYLNEEMPMDVDYTITEADAEGSLRYFSNPNEKWGRDGATKDELQLDPRMSAGYLIAIHEDNQNVTLQGTDRGSLYVEDNYESEVFADELTFRKLSTDDLFVGEEGLTLEQWIVLFLSNLKRGKVIDAQSNKPSVPNLILSTKSAHWRAHALRTYWYTWKGRLQIGVSTIGEYEGDEWVGQDDRSGPLESYPRTAVLV